MQKKKIAYYCTGCIFIFILFIAMSQSAKRFAAETASQAAADALRDERWNKEKIIDEYIIENSDYGITNAFVLVRDNNEVSVSIYSHSLTEDNFQDAVLQLTEVTKRAINKFELTLISINIAVRSYGDTTLFEWNTYDPYDNTGMLRDHRVESEPYLKTSVDINEITAILYQSPAHMRELMEAAETSLQSRIKYGFDDANIRKMGDTNYDSLSVTVSSYNALQNSRVVLKFDDHVEYIRDIVEKLAEEYQLPITRLTVSVYDIDRKLILQDIVPIYWKNFESSRSE